MASTTEVNISDNIRFFGSLMGTPGISAENNDLCNEYINKELKALRPFVQDYVEEAKEVIKQRKEALRRITEEPSMILAPEGNDYNALNIVK